MLKASLSDYGNAYIVVKGAITVANVGTIAAPNNRNIKVIFENCIPFTDCISKINNTEVDNATDIDIVTPMYSLQNIVIINKKREKVYGNNIKMSQF